MEASYEKAITGKLILNCLLHPLQLYVLRHNPLIAHLFRGEADFLSIRKSSVYKALTYKW